MLQDTVFTARYINNEDEINPTAVYLSRREDWADLQYGKYTWITTAAFIPENVTFTDVTWSSSNEDIATVDEQGNVSLLGTGDVDIKATHRSGKSASYTLHVYDSKETEVQKVTGVRFDTAQVTIKAGASAPVRWTLEPKGQALQNTMVMYESGNESVASVNYQGVVTAKRPGTAVITVSVMPMDPDEEGDYHIVTATCKVTVKLNLKGTKITSLKRASGAVTVKWKRQAAKVLSSHISGYQIQLAANKKFTKNRKTVTVKGYKTTSRKIGKLKGGKRYYVRVRTYKVLKGKKYYSSWSGVRSVVTRR